MHAFITAALRTPVGRAGGALAPVRADDLASHVISSVVERTQLPVDEIDDVILGCTNQAGEDNRNVARMGALLAGLPIDVPGQTINRLCGSGLQAVASAAQAIRANEGDLFVAGGVESMTRAPYVMLKTGQAWSRGTPAVADSTIGWRFVNPRMSPEWTISLGQTAERVAELHHISREEQDAFALESQRRAQAAIAEGHFDEEIVPVEVPGKKTSTTFAVDEHPRPDVTLEGLAKLKPAFQAGGTVTAGNSSGINDGAAALAVLSEAALERAGAQPLARIVTSAVAGVDPACMGLGPIPATRKALARAGLSVDDLDVIELNEAFAAQAIPCIRELQFDPARVNVSGGAIALGHPLGATGAKILTTLVHALRRTGGRYGLVTMCIGVGQGIAMIIERVNHG
ncbi:MAG: thiolase family protein [Gemmatimonadales bacterium]|nr:thiolase family protein [Gemmatimonadales bacterium]